MLKRYSKLIATTIALIAFSLPVVAQDTSADEEEPQGPVPSFGLGLDIGYASLPSADGSELIGWQSLKLSPDIGIGEFGIGFDVNVNFRFDGGPDGNSFEFREDDWVVSDQRSFLDIYLPLFKYIRYGKKGSPLFALIGGIDRGTLGNGFIVGGYRNTVFMPDYRILGLLFDLDGKLFDFPLIGVETIVDNLARFDLVAFRAYLRPLGLVDIDIVKDVQIGFTLAYDSNPHLYNPDSTIKSNTNGDEVLIYGVDMKAPIIAGDLFSLAIFGDIALQQGKVGSQVGFGGSIVQIFDYIMALRFMGEGFLPSYFDANYDNFREQKYSVYDGTSNVPAYNGYYGRLGLNIAQDILTFGIAIDGPFYPDANAANANPNLSADLTLKKGSILKDLSFNAFYHKEGLEDWADLVSPLRAVIGAKIGYSFGPATISMIYNVRYDPNSTRTDANGNTLLWQVTSKLETSISIVDGGGQL